MKKIIIFFCLMMTIFMTSSEAALDINTSPSETNKYPYSADYGTSFNPLKPQNDLQRQNEEFEKQRQEQQKQFDEELERQRQESQQHEKQYQEWEKQFNEKMERWRQGNQLDTEQLSQDYDPPKINTTLPNLSDEKTERWLQENPLDTEQLLQDKINITVPNPPNEPLQKNNFDEDKSTHIKDDNSKLKNIVYKKTLPEPTFKDKILHFLTSSNFNFFILGIIFSIVSLLIYKLKSDIKFRHNIFDILKGISTYLGLSLASYIIIPLIIMIVITPFVLDLFLAKYIYDFFYDLIGISFFASIPAIIIFAIIAIPLIILMTYFFTNN